MAIINITLTDTFDDWRVKSNEHQNIVGIDIDANGNPTNLAAVIDGLGSTLVDMSNLNYTNIGDLTTLATTDKTDLVSAINEVDVLLTSRMDPIIAALALG